MKAILTTILAGLTLLPAAILAADKPVFPGALPVFLTNASVSSDLGLSSSQEKQLQKLRSDYKADARSVTSRFPDSATGRKAANTVVGQLNAKYNAKALAVLSPAQQARLEQIGHQTLGGLMLYLPAVQEKLAISDSQKSALEKLRGDWESVVQKVNRAYEAGEVDLHDRLQELRSWRKKFSAKIIRLLTPDQRKRLDSMQGQAFKTA